MPNIPKDAKSPQDHQSKTEKPKVEHIELTIGEGDAERSIPARRVTLHGLTLTVQDRALNDYRVVKLLARQGANDALANIKSLDIVLGEEQHDQVAERFQDEDGFVDQQAVGEFTRDLFQALNPNS